MLRQKSAWLIAASCLALILLVFIQVNWLRHSRRLLEEQFDQKVTMALCNAVEELNKPEQSQGSSPAVSCEKMPGNCIAGYFNSPESEQELQQALKTSLNRYDIDLDFQFNVLPPESTAPLLPASCSAPPDETVADTAIQVTFSEKEQYLISQLGFMMGSSILILVFVSSLLMFTLLKFLRQKQLNEVSVDFFNNMAHEFRTPLTNMQLALNLYKKRRPETSGNRFLDVIQTENKRLLEQVERMLHVAKLEKGKYQFDLEELDLQSLVEDVVEDMKIPVAARNGVAQLECRCTGPLIVRGDRLHLSNSIRNLLDNAIKYCEQSPLIAIRLEQRDQGACLSIQDNGVGIPERQRSAIFEPFRRGVNGNVHDQKGFGLGLAYVRRVIEQHGGTLSLESELNRGSRFSICLPLMPVRHA